MRFLNCSKKIKINTLVTIVIFLFSVNLMFAAVKMPKLFNDNMLIQRDLPIQVWGWADAGEKITVKLGTQSKSVKADKQGNWRLTLSPLPAGGPYEMAVKGKKNTVQIKNILLGDVWICSGQSNMEWSVKNTNNAKEEIANANFPQIRILDVPNTRGLKPLADMRETGWKEAIKENIENFSSVGYFFGRYLHQELNVPIGLIGTNWGGTVVETWMSLDKLKKFPEFNEKINWIEQQNQSVEELEAKFKQKSKDWMDKYYISQDKGLEENWAAGDLNDQSWAEMMVPGEWEKAGLPDVDGVVWFRKKFTLPENLKGMESLYLRLGSIADFDMVWINGQKIGETLQKKPWRSYRFSSSILNQTGENTVAVRVFDYGESGGMVEAAPEKMVLATTRTGDDAQTLALSGNWKYKVSIQKKFEPGIQEPVPIDLGPNANPAMLYHGMIAPLIPYGIKGAIWYQGESNAGRAYQYRDLFPAMIENWREKWGQGDFPFLFVQLANFRQPVAEPAESDWAELREAQNMALTRLPNTGVAVIIDIGEANDIHPRNKQDVGKRLALSALKVGHNKNIVFSGPMYDRMEVEGNKIRIKFNCVGSGLMIKDKYGYLKGFAIADASKKFIWAKAYLDGNDVIVYNETIQNPVAVRYGWANNPDDVNLYNKEGLPASPFRTDDWPGITFGKK